MSEVLLVAKALSRSTDDDLVRVAAVRLMPTSTFKDFFDFATALLKPQNVSGAISALSKRQILTFSNLLNQRTLKSDQASLESLATMCLVLKQADGTYKPVDSAVSAFKQLVTAKLLAQLVEPIEPTELEELVDRKQIDSQAGVSAFETVQAMTELLLELEQHYVREVGKGQVGLPELKRLSKHLGRDIEYVRLLYSLAQMSSLIGVSEKRWKVSSQYLTWLSSTPEQRWQHLAKTWLSLVGPHSALELANASYLQESFNQTFPIANPEYTTHLSRLISLAEIIGLSSYDKTTTWYKPLLECKLDKATKLLAEKLPQTQNKIIIQADLTIIAVGPLPTDKELELRRFVVTERIGVASTYRINTLSITYGLETGLTEESIRTLLMDLSGKSLPQPVDYLIREAASRFGRLVVREDASGSIIESSEPILLAQILNDTSLRSLDISKVSETTLVTRFDVELVYHLLRESNYAAIHKDSSGGVISSWRAAGTKAKAALQTSSVLEDIQRLRAHEKRLGEAPQGTDLVRQIEMAIKTRATIVVSVKVNGSPREFSIEPTGLANGRLRGKDRQADCERVLPLASVTGVRLG